MSSIFIIELKHSGIYRMNKFVILTEIRTGYKWLASLITSHPEAFCFGEIFGSVQGVRQASLFKEPIVAITEKENPVTWLQNNVEKWAEEKNLSAVGFKVNYVDGKHKPNWYPLWEYLASGEYKIIHLKRGNTFDRTLSELLANKEGNWSDKEYESKLTIKPFHLIKMMIKSEIWQTEAEKLFPNRFDIYYEQIAEQSPEIMDMQRFIGLDPIPLATYQRKQRKGKQSDYIENYSELSIMIRTYFPRYAHMLEPPYVQKIKM